MKNRLVARILYEIADLLEMEGVAFKPRAYRRAAQAVESCPVPVEDLVATGKLNELPGVGKAIAGKIEEIVKTGKLAYHEELKKKLPIDLFSLTKVDGIGPKTAKLLYDVLGVRTLDDLEQAARSGRIQKVKGLGKKTEERILRGLAEARRTEARMLLGHAYPIADDLQRRLRKTGLFTRLEVAGSLRRGRETIGDLDILGIASDPERAAEAFVSLSDVEEVLAHGPKKSSVRLSSGLQVDLRIVPQESFGAALQYFTGSKAHNIALRKRAVAREWKLNEYGLFDETGKVLAGRTEEDIYTRLGLLFIPPELREDQGEIAAAEAGTLPNLVELSDIRGDLHVHTDWSDGKAPLAVMAAEAQKRGLSYIAVTDHAKFSEMVRGLTPDDIRRQIDEIARLNEELDGFRIFTGIEANILPDGSLDLPNEILRQLDIVVASVHSHLHLDRTAMTNRLIRAVENEHVFILAHPTGRKIGEHPAYDADWDKVFRRAASAGTAVEINANPIRLDLNGELARRAIEFGVRITIDTDAHDPTHFDFLKLGVITARRGWVEKSNVINTLSSGELLVQAQTKK